MHRSSIAILFSGIAELIVERYRMRKLNAESSKDMVDILPICQVQKRFLESYF